MSKLHLEDLKEQGLELTKQDAQELHHRINEISQRGAEGYNEVFSGYDTPSSINPDKSKDKNLLGLVEKLTQVIEEKDEYIGQLETRIDELQDQNYIKPDIQHGGDESNNTDPEENIQGPENKGDDGDDTPAFKFSRPIPGEHHKTKAKRLADSGLKEHTVTQDDLDNNPELAEAGVKVGEVIEIPIQ